MSNYLSKFFAFVCVATATQTLSPVSALASFPRKVVTEELTGTWCMYCPSGIVALEEVSDSHPDNFFPIAVHCNDVMTVTDYYSRLKERIGKAGAPYAYTMRSLKYSGAVNNLATRVDYLTLTETYAMVEVTAQLNENIVEVSGTLASDQELAEGKWGLELILTEDDVYHPDSKAYDQENAYADSDQQMGGFEDLPNPVPASEMHYMDVARIAFPVPETDLPLSVRAGENTTFATSFELPGRVDNAANCKVTALLLDEKGEVVNSWRCPLAVDTSGIDFTEQSVSDESLTATVWTLDGRPVYTGPVNGIGSIPVAPGLYLVRHAGSTTKVVVR